MTPCEVEVLLIMAGPLLVPACFHGSELLPNRESINHAGDGSKHNDWQKTGEHLCRRERLCEGDSLRLRFRAYSPRP